MAIKTSLFIILFLGMILSVHIFALGENVIPEMTHSQFMPSMTLNESEPISAIPEPEYMSLGKFNLTAYCPCVKCCGVWSTEHSSRIGTGYIQTTASGTIPSANKTISVDTGVIPFGTTVIIGNNEYTAEDRGGSIKGNRIDIFFNTHSEAIEFGRQTAEIYIKNFN